MSKQKLVQMIFYEMGIILLLGNVIGFLLVMLTKVFVVQVFQIKFTPPGGIVSYPLDFIFQLDSIIGVAIIPVIGTVLLGCVYPLMRIAKLEITKVLEG